MTFNSSLSAASTWMTYFVQIASGYLVTWSLCALVQKPAVRLRVWRCFLFLTVAGWLVLLAPPVGRAMGSTIFPAAARGDAALYWSLPVTRAWESQLDSLGTWALRLYLVILVLSLFQLFWQRLRIEALLRSGQQPSPELSLLFRSLCREMRVSTCKLSLAKQLPSPGTACWYRPHVFLPVEMVPRVTGSQLVDILRHELIHVRGRDYLWDRLAALACRVVCFHPAVWLAYRHLHWETELACDQEVVADHAESRFRYAECLTRLATWRFLAEGKSAGGVGFSASASLLATRVRALLLEPSPRSLFQQAGRSGLIALLVSLAVFFLPGMGLTLYWLVPPLQAIQPSSTNVRRASHVRLASKASQARTQRTLAGEPAGVRAENARPNQLTSLFTDLNAPPTPVLSNPDEGSGSIPDIDEKIGPRASDAIWDESSVIGARAPSWNGVTDAAIRIGLSLGQVEPGSQSGRPDRDPTPSKRFP